MCKLYIYLVIGFISGCAHIGAASGPMKIVEEKVTVDEVKQCIAPGPKCSVVVSFSDGTQEESITTFSRVKVGDVWVRDCRHYPETGATYCNKFWRRQ